MVSTASPVAPAEQQQLAVGDNGERVMEFIPFGEKEAVKLTMPMVRNFIANKTKSGHSPSDTDLMQFMMICKSRRLNPWTKDAYLIGYDSNDGPTFSIVVAVQALFKRAEMNPDFDGIESGVIIRLKGDKDNPPGPIMYREGDFLLPTEELLGGWARVFSKGRARPTYDALNLVVYSKNTAQWRKDPAGMIVKCAEASTLRKAYPSDISGLYFEDEMHRDAIETTAKAVTSERSQPRTISALNQQATPEKREDKPRSAEVVETSVVEDEGEDDGPGPVLQAEQHEYLPLDGEESEEYVSRIRGLLVAGMVDQFRVIDVVKKLGREGSLTPEQQASINSSIRIEDGE